MFRFRFIRKNHSKVLATPEEALKKAQLKSNSTLLVGGFGLCGIPMGTINAISKINVDNLTVVSNNCGVNDWGLGLCYKRSRSNAWLAVMLEKIKNSRDNI